MLGSRADFQAENILHCRPPQSYHQCIKICRSHTENNITDDIKRLESRLAFWEGTNETDKGENAREALLLQLFVHRECCISSILRIRARYIQDSISRLLFLSRKPLIILTINGTWARVQQSKLSLATKIIISVNYIQRGSYTPDQPYNRKKSFSSRFSVCCRAHFPTLTAAQLQSSVPRVNDLAVNPFQAESEKWPKTERHTLLEGAFLLYDTTVEQTIHVTISMHLPYLESQHLHLDSNTGAQDHVSPDRSLLHSMLLQNRIRLSPLALHEPVGWLSKWDQHLLFPAGRARSRSKQICGKRERSDPRRIARLLCVSKVEGLTENAMANLPERSNSRNATLRRKDGL